MSTAMQNETYEVNGYPVEVIKVEAHWGMSEDGTRQHYFHNYKLPDLSDFWSIGQYSSTCMDFRSLAGAKRSLRNQTNEKAGWSQNQRFVMIELRFVGNPKLDTVSVTIHASN